MKTKPIALWLIVLCLFICRDLSLYAQQAPPLPHAFFGTVEIAGQPAPLGTKVEARGEGVRTGVVGNPIEVVQVGKYGGAGGFDPKLVVQGDVKDGTAIEFYVNGVKAQCAEPGGQWLDSYPFKSGGITELNLRAGPSAMPTGQVTPVATSTVAPTALPTSQATPTVAPTALPTSQATPTVAPTALPTGQATPTVVPTALPTNQAIPVATATGVETPPTPLLTPTAEATALSTVEAPGEPTVASTLTVAMTQAVNQTAVALIEASASTPIPESTPGSSQRFWVGLVVIVVAIGAVVIAATRRRRNT